MDFNVTQLFQGDSVSLVVKGFAVFFLSLFILYSLLTLKEVSIMNHSLETRLSFEIQLLAWFQLILGLVALFIVVVFG